MLVEIDPGVSRLGGEIVSHNTTDWLHWTGLHLMCLVGASKFLVMAHWFCQHFYNMACLRVLCSDRFSFFSILQNWLAWCAPLVSLHMHMQIYRFTAIFLLEKHVELQRFRSCSDSISRWSSSNWLKLNPLLL